MEKNEKYIIGDESTTLYTSVGEILIDNWDFSNYVRSMVEGKSKYDIFSMIQRTYETFSSETIIEVLDIVLSYISDKYKSRNIEQEKKLRLAQLEHLYKVAVEKEDTRSAESILAKIIEFSGLSDQMERVIDEWHIDFGEPIEHQDEQR